MDFTVENGYKCGLCPKRLASKYSLERHIRLKHRSDLEENASPAKKQKLEISEQMQENNNTHIDIEKLDLKKASDIDSDQESGNNTELDRNNNNNVYANNAGWVETDNIQELDNNNGQSEDSNMESDNTEDVDNNTDTMESDNTEDVDDMELDNNKEIDSKETDNNKEMENSESEESVMEDMQCTKELDFKHNLFDVIETCKDMCDKFGNCDNLATFRIHPSPVGMGYTNKYIEWMRELFTGILDYFNQKYTPDAEDYISFGMLHAKYPDKGMWLWMRKYKELNVNKFVDIFYDARIQPVGDLTIWYKHKKIKQGCQTCGHA